MADNDSDSREESEVPPPTTAHPTAVKVGGMRIVQDKRHVKKKSESEEVVQVEEKALLVQTPKVDGITQGNNADFPPDAVRAYHEKPKPTHSANDRAKPHVAIHQPRK